MIDMKRLLARVEEFLDTHYLSDSAFGLKAGVDHKFVTRLRAGEVVFRRQTIGKVVRFMDEFEAASRPKKPKKHA